MSDYELLADSELGGSDTDLHCYPQHGVDDLYLGSDAGFARGSGRVPAMFFCFPGDIYTLFEPGTEYGI